MPSNRLFARFTMELSMDTEPIGASSAEMDQRNRKNKNEKDPYVSNIV